MAKLLMITGRGSAVDLASGKRGAFYNMLEEFHKYWNRIDIITPKVEKPAQIIFENVYIHSSPWPLLVHPVFFIRKALEIYRQHKFDLITVQEFPPFYNGIAARLLWSKIRVPYVLEIHHITGYPKAGNFKEKVYKWLSRIFLKFDSSKAKAIRVVNQKQVPEFLIKAGVPKEKIVYIPSMYIDLDIFRPMNLQKKYDLIFIGRLVKNKGLKLFLEAARKLNLKAVIVGDGPLKGKSESNITFYGWAKDPEEIAKLMNQSRVLVVSSYNEGGPRVLLEAMACGVPVITTRIGLALDVINDGENGFFIDWLGESITEKASILLEDEELQKKFALSGLEKVKQFEKKAAISNYAAKLQKLI